MLRGFKTVGITEFLRINGSCKLFGMLCHNAGFETSELLVSRLPMSLDLNREIDICIELTSESQDLNKISALKWWLKSLFRVQMSC